MLTKEEIYCLISLATLAASQYEQSLFNSLQSIIEPHSEDMLNCLESNTALHNDLNVINAVHKLLNGGK